MVLMLLLVLMWVRLLTCIVRNLIVVLLRLCKWVSSPILLHHLLLMLASNSVVKLLLVTENRLISWVYGHGGWSASSSSESLLNCWTSSVRWSLASSTSFTPSSWRKLTILNLSLFFAVWTTRVHLAMLSFIRKFLQAFGFFLIFVIWEFLFSW